MLERCGIEPRRYWILVELFDTLSERRAAALMDRVHSIRARAIFVFVFSNLFSGVFSYGMLTFGTAPGRYLVVFLVLTMVLLGGILIAAVAENLVNPVEGLILAHQPINGATWSGARLTHLVKVVVYVVAAINSVPALAGVLLPHTGRVVRLVYPPMHVLLALGAGLVVALLCCSLFGWLVRFVPVRRLKAAAALVQTVPLLFMYGYFFLPELAAQLVRRAGSIALPAGWLAAGEAVPGGFLALLGATGAAVAIGAVVFGLRALSTDHLIRVSGLMQSPTGTRRRRWKRLQAGPWIARVAGGQASRAGYEFLRAMMVRDWQFRRTMAIQSAGVIILFVALLVVWREASPFDPGFAYMHALPHLIGATIFGVCGCLPYSDDYQGLWSFGVAPESSFRPFVRGIHASLGLMLVVLPNVFWLLVLAWSWGVGDAVFFIAFSTVVASLYLAVGLRLIDGVPFGKQPLLAGALPEARRWVFMLTYLVVLVLAIGIQYVLFRSVAAVVVATVVVGLGTYPLTRAGLVRCVSRMESHLTPGPPRSIFHLVETEEG